MHGCKVKRKWLGGGYQHNSTFRVGSAVYAARFDDEKVVCGSQGIL